MIKATSAQKKSWSDFSPTEDFQIPGNFAQFSELFNSIDVTERNRLYMAHYQQHTALWMATLAREQGKPYQPIIKPEAGDRRFSAPEWSENPFYDYLKQAYLLNAKLLRELIHKVELDEKLKNKLAFAIKQYVDAMSPANFAATNPEVIKLALETKGKSLTSGMKNLITDIEKGHISLTDESAFEVGKNIAVSQGAVVFENPLIQLIQYSPATNQVYEKPLLVVPPCINKFYILDLQPINSFVRYAVEQGYTVFMISWRNTHEELGKLTWDDYLVDGIMKGMQVTLDITGERKLNTLGWCIGGTLLCSALAVMRKQGSLPVESMTLLTTMLDYAEPGDIGLFVTRASVEAREKAIGQEGVMKGAEIAALFSNLRPNDLIWPYVVNNYFKGKTPDPFDLLYWNSDSTNLPGPMYCWYVRNTYLENNFVGPKKLAMCGQKVSMADINLSTYIFAAKEDHIVPWKAGYASTQLLSGDLTFVLGASGHIAGVINPVSKNKRHYWVNDRITKDPNQWLASANEKPGSWWSHWENWLKSRSGKQIAARVELGSQKYKVIEAAPGRYVKEKA